MADQEQSREDVRIEQETAPPESLMEHLARCQRENLPEYQQAVGYLCARYVSMSNLDGWCTQLFGYLLSGQVDPAKESARLLYAWHRQQVTKAGGTHLPETLEEAYAVYVAQMFADRTSFEGERLPDRSEHPTVQ